MRSSLWRARSSTPWPSPDQRARCATARQDPCTAETFPSCFLPSASEAVECLRVVADDLAPHVRGQMPELPLEILLRVGPHAVGMREVGAPHDLVGAELVQELDADRV